VKLTASREIVHPSASVPSEPLPSDSDTEIEPESIPPLSVTSTENAVVGSATVPDGDGSASVGDVVSS
jgi:hypothetical protein